MIDSKKNHTCRGIVVSCMDFRLGAYISEFTQVNFRENDYDRLSLAGSVKDIDFVINQIGLSYKLHCIKEVHLINHEDCGAYGKEGTYGKHLEDLRRATQRIKKDFPRLKVFIYYLKLNGEIIRI